MHNSTNINNWSFKFPYIVVHLKSALFLLSFSLMCFSSKAKNYYISTAGNDSNTGLSTTSSWKTVSKLNRIFNILQPGDSVLFKCGDTFYGTVIIIKSGTTARPIILSSYGKGSKPCITGFTTVIDWKDEGGGVFSTNLTAAVQTNMVTINGLQYAMGRYPDKGYLIYQNSTDNTSITDMLLGANTNWAGAEVVIRKNDFSLDRCAIISQTGHTINYKNKCSKYPAKPNYGYFIQNDLRTLTNFGEWYHDTFKNTFYIYFGISGPKNKLVKIATLNNLIKATSSEDNVTINNIKLVGSIDNAIYLAFGNNNWNFKNNDISFSGKNGVYIGTGGINDTLSKNNIYNCNNDGILCFGTSTVISKNNVTYIGIVPGQAIDPYYYTGIYTAGNASLITFNYITNIGGTGIYTGAHGLVTISYNRVDSTCILLDDGAGIYTSDVDDKVRIFDHNIITNTIGNDNGTTRKVSIASGIYLDDLCSNVLVTYNTCAYNKRAGIFIHRGSNNSIKYNTCYNNKQGILFQNNSSTSDIFANVVLGNILLAKDNDQFAAQFLSNNNDISNFGVFDSNYYAKPFDSRTTINISQPSGEINKSVEEWKSFNKQDVNSKKTSIATKNSRDIIFKYNDSNVSTKIAFKGLTYVDVMGNFYKNYATIPAWYSIILIAE